MPGALPRLMTIDRVIRRRILLGFLIAASFGLLTAWYREVDNGPLHSIANSVSANGTYAYAATPAATAQSSAAPSTTAA